MAGFDYTGLARIQWGGGLADSEHFIDYVAARGTLRVWPLETAPNSAPHPQAAWVEYIGSMKDHPAVHMVFLHRTNG